MTIRPSDIFGSAAPKTVLNKPLFHAQDRKTLNTSGGTSVNGENDRDLNTEVTNEISGASLNTSTGVITLPAGVYWVEAVVPAYPYDSGAGRATSYLYNITDSEISLQSTGGRVYATDLRNHINGRLVLSSTKTFKVVTNSTIAVAGGLGTAVNRGSHELYTDLKIWQLDAQVKTPIIINDKLYPLPGTTMVTGNMHGLEYAKTGANQITVQPGICMDSTNNEVLSISTATALTIGTTINQVYNIFLCKETSGGAMVLEYDTDVDGANISSDKDAIRWIGLVVNDSSGDLEDFRQWGNEIEFDTPGGIFINSNPASTTPFVPGYATFGFPTSRILTVALWGQTVSALNVGILDCFPDGTTAEYQIFQLATGTGTLSNNGTNLTYVPIDMKVGARSTSGDDFKIGVKRILMKR